MAKGSIVCVTGGAGYIGSWLVRKLLQRGHVVHATLRNLDDKSKVQLLKSLDGADDRLHLFKAEIYHPEEFEAAIHGCEFVFHVATPLFQNRGVTQYKDTTEASLAAARSIMSACERSGSVRRVIYLGSLMSASPFSKENNISGGEQYTVDESSWTPLHLPFTQMDEFERNYIWSKTLTEKELLGCSGQRGVEVASLACGLVGGDSILGYLPASMSVVISPLTGQKIFHNQLKLLQEMFGSVPSVHVDDICEALLFVMEKPSGRFLCASCHPSMQQIVEILERECPNALVLKDVEGSTCCKVNYSSKLVDLGFKYKYDVDQIVAGSVAFAKRIGSMD